jgi:hypothetical protein
LRILTEGDPESETIMRSMLINDQIVEIIKPLYLEDENKTCMFAFKTFNKSGVVQNPKLFDINFVCEPNPSESLPAIIQYHGIIVDEKTADFLEYNQYYSVHPINIGRLNGDEDNSKPMNQVLGIYYSPNENPNYNIRFLDLKDLEEFNNVVCLSYMWKTPIIYKFNENPKKEKHRLITVECNKEIIQKINNDNLLRYESKTANLSSEIISKSFIVPKSDRSDIEGHLLAEYGLIPYTIIISTPKTEIDYDRMKEIHDSQMIVLKKIYENQ